MKPQDKDYTITLYNAKNSNNLCISCKVVIFSVRLFGTLKYVTL